MRIKPIFQSDPYLEPYKVQLVERNERILNRLSEIAGEGRLSDAVNNHLFYMLHKENRGWVFREWAPNASKIYLVGDFNGWKRCREYELSPIGGGAWEIVLPENAVHHGDLYKWYVEWPGGAGERIPAYAFRNVQDPETKVFSAQVWDPQTAYTFKNAAPEKVDNPLVYEAHIGMSSEEEKVSTFNEFREKVLPRIAELGYNTIQIMALQEHPYYGSFGYQVSSFFALSSRFGTPEEFKRLVDDAHGLGLAVVMDIVHSHAVSNELEGIGMIDGSDCAYCHSGARGIHPAWNSRCFDYGKSETQYFLLSNCKFWLEEYHLDGFRFDGVTSMIYHDHGLGRDFVGYSDYFDGSADEDAITYLALANILVKEVNPDANTTAEDMSGMPGLAAPLARCGVGFDFRLSMGVPDHWIKWIKESDDSMWSMGEIYYELTNRRSDEKTISYAESHDQAMVGDKTIIFRLIDASMYTSMNIGSQDSSVDRGIALHKMIRLVTMATAGDGYLNFMGNEFGHPEWIDFPREGNGWSYKYARRQWSLVDSDYLRYRKLNNFDRDMVHLFSKSGLFHKGLELLGADEEKKVLIFTRGEYLFTFNFNPASSFENYEFEVKAGCYVPVLDSDRSEYDGFDRNETMEHFTMPREDKNVLSLYLPCRTATVWRRKR